MATMTYAQIVNAANFGRDFHATNHDMRGKQVAVCTSMKEFSHLDWSDDMTFHTLVMASEKTATYAKNFDRAQVEEHGNFVRYVVSYECWVMMLVMNDGTVVYNSQKNMEDAKGRRLWDRLFDSYWGNPRYYGDKPVTRKIFWSEFRAPMPAGH